MGLWVIDALDGSRNFLLGIPIFGISIALVEHDKVKFGMVLLPYFNDLYWADSDGPAYLGTWEIQVCNEEQIEHGMIAMVAVSGVAEPEQASEIEVKLGKYGIWPMNLGCLVVPLCYVGAGKYMGAIYTRTATWDVAA